MSESYTASFHNGGMEKDGIDSRGRKRKKLYQACREHNIRDPKYCDKQDHIIKGGVHEIWIDIPPKQAYEQIFGEAFREYNSKQRKKERQFNTYWEKVKKSAVLVPVCEALITIGNCEDGFPDLEVGKQIYEEFLEEFQNKNPNMVVIGAYYHADEMRSDGKGGVIKGAPHMHLDYIPVAYKCDRGQKIQNSMNGALMEQGILNIEVDPEVAEKVYGLRKKPRRRKQNASLEEVPLSELLQCFEKLEEKPEQTEQTEEGEKITKPRVVTNLQQWTDTQRNRLKKITCSHGFEITEKNEKREHLTTEDYILSKNPNLNHDVHALAERLTNDLKEVQKESADNAEWEKENQEQAEQNVQTAKELEKAKEEHNAYVEQKEYDFKRKEYKLSDKEDELKEREEEVTKKETFLTNARKHASESLHKFVQKLKKKNKEEVPENLLKRNFFALESNKKYVSDITYLYGKECVKYLSMIEDLFNEEIVAWIISDHPDEELCENTLVLLAAERNLEGAIFHADQGSTYLSPKFKEKIKFFGMIQSCSARGVCWDNASMESANGIIKTECLYNKFGKSKFKNRQIPIDEVVAEIAPFIEYYNNERPKQSLGGLSPVQFREQNPKGTYLMVIKN